MTILVWDGKLLAADKQATSVGLRRTVTKLCRSAQGALMGWVGQQDTGLIMRDWYNDGANLKEYPECQKDKAAWSTLVVITSEGLFCYEQFPSRMKFEDGVAAFGSGRDYALGAMAMGADAKRAVEIASRFENGCGMGVDVIQL